MPTNHTNLTGLDLRRKVMEAMGWKIDESFREGWRYWLVRPNGGDVLSSNLTIETVIERMPAIELDPAVSEPLFLEFCQTHDNCGFTFKYQPHFPDDSQYQIELFIPSLQIGPVYGATPSEARARAVLAAATNTDKENL